MAIDEAQGPSNVYFWISRLLDPKTQNREQP